MSETLELTANEREQARQSAIKAMRKRLELTRPDPGHYLTGESRAVRLITSTLIWSKAFVPVIALLAAIASAVRTVQTAAEIYTASGSHPVGVLLAAVAFTLAAEGALFTLALAQEGQRMKYRAEGRPRRVASLKNAWQGMQVRIGIREPLRYDQLPEKDGLAVVMTTAFAFAVASNAYLGLRPLLSQIGAVSLQGFVGSIVNADARLQMNFIVDLAAVFFPPFMALKAGHLTARFAAELAEISQAVKTAYEKDMARWHVDYAEPLDSEAGQELLQSYLTEKLAAKRARKAAQQPLPQVTPVEVPTQQERFLAAQGGLSSNGNGHQ